MFDEGQVQMSPISSSRLTPGRRIALAFIGSAATVVSYLCAVANGIAAGALIGLPSRVADVIVVQRHAKYWSYVAIGFQLLVIAVVSPLVPPGPSDDSSALRTVCRLGISALICVGATLLLGTIIFSLITLRRHTRH
jgi:hypothetical protein